MEKEQQTFLKERIINIDNSSNDAEYKQLGNLWLQKAINYKYALNFDWLGIPIIQLPTDIYAIQELIWNIKPDLIIETGIARGGSLIMSASILALIDHLDGISLENSFRKVVGVDIDLREHNRKLISEHKLSKMLEIFDGSSIDIKIYKEVLTFSKNFKNIMVFLDSNHTHDHVLQELELYAPLVTKGSYCIVWDTGVEDLPIDFIKDRPWGKGNNPKTAVNEYLFKISSNNVLDINNKKVNFEIDKFIENKISITASPDGFLKRV